MKDFAVRIWDSKNKEMVTITDLRKVGDITTTEDPMIASPFYDDERTRLFENDIVRINAERDPKVDGDLAIVRLTDIWGWIFDYSYIWHDEIYRWLESKGGCTKVGTVYENPDMMKNAVKEKKKKEEAEKREKELQCLMKLKAKYEGERQ